MADRTDFYFRQRVTEAELDLAFEQLERADRDLAADIGVRGILEPSVFGRDGWVPRWKVPNSSRSSTLPHQGSATVGVRDHRAARPRRIEERKLGDVRGPRLAILS
ncbi:MAG: hypothetical protein ACOC1U_04960 [Spirochaetota bacterium]